MFEFKVYPAFIGGVRTERNELLTCPAYLRGTPFKKNNVVKKNFNPQYPPAGGLEDLKFEQQRRYLTLWTNTS